MLFRSRQALALEKYPHTFRPAMISSLRRSRSVQRMMLEVAANYEKLAVLAANTDAVDTGKPD